MTVPPLDEPAQGNRAMSRETREQIEALRSEITRLSENIASVGQAKIEDYKAAVESLAQNAVASSLDAFKVARDQATNMEHQFEDQIRANPLRAILVAAGVGLLVGFLARRK